MNNLTIASAKIRSFVDAHKFLIPFHSISNYSLTYVNF